LSIFLFFFRLAAEGEFENLIDDSLPATRHRSKNIIDSENKTSDADEKTFTVDSDYSYDNEIPIFTFTAENEFSNDYNYELVSEKTAVDPLLQLTCLAVIIYFSRNVSRQLTVEKMLKGEKPVAQIDAANNTFIADPSLKVIYGAIAPILPAIFANLFYTFTGCIYELHAQ
jgi:hypothetical protein